MKQVSWKEKTARKLIMWLLRYVPEWMVLRRNKWGRTKARVQILKVNNSTIRSHAIQTARLADKVVAENKQLRAEIEQLKEDAEIIVIEEAKAENERLRRELEDVQRSHNALLEEMAELVEEMEELRNG